MLQIRNARLATGGPLVCLQIIMPFIVGITDRPVPTTNLDFDHDARGDWVLPGGIDGHVHIRFPGNPRAETVPNLSLDALAGGTTSVFGMPNTNPPLTTAEGIVTNLALMGDQPIRYHAWLGLLPDRLSEIDNAVDVPDIPGGKLYGSKTTGGLFIETLPEKYALCERAADKQMIVAVHAQNQAMIDFNRGRIKRPLNITDHCDIQSAEVEISAVMDFLKIQRETKCRMVFCHLSAWQSLELVQDAKQRGADVYVEVCPQHFVRMDSSWLARIDGWRVKMNPSLRSLEDMIRMQSYVCSRGWVDFVHTDHAPHEASEEGVAKLALNYDDIPSGMTGVRNRMLIMFDLVSQGLMSIEHMVELTSANAARVFRLEGLGKIAEGAYADLCLISPYEQTLVQDRNMFTRCGWTPWHGEIFSGRIRATVAKGKFYSF